MTTQEARVKPTYTVRLTEDLDPAERARVAERVAGTTDIDASKFERLLERGTGKDLIRPSSASVANRLASVLAEAGAPVQLVPVGSEVDEPVDVAPSPSAGAPEAADVEEDQLLRPRREAAEPTSPAPPPPVTGATAPPATGAEEALPEPGDVEDEVPDVREEFPPTEPVPRASEPAPEPDVYTDEAPEVPRRSLLHEPPPRPPERRGSGLLGAVGAALMGIGAFFGMGFLVDPLAIGILVLAVLALGLALLGQRRATWLPGLGALALIVWALGNAEAGIAATLADHWQWYAMFAGALLVIIAGWREARLDRGP